MTNTNFNTLPQEVQEQAKSVLRAFPRVHITFEYGKYHVSSGIALLASYPEDFKVIGDYTDKEIFTEDERTLNYINSFHDYPIWYKGKRDYRWLNSLTWNDTVTFNSEHELVLA